MPKNINCITIIISLQGIEKIKTEKNDNVSLFQRAKIPFSSRISQFSP